jgi:WD40 repeat protein
MVWGAEPQYDHVRLPIAEPDSLGFSPDGRTLMVFEGGPQWSVARWDVRSGSSLERKILGRAGYHVSSAFSHDSHVLAVKIHDGAIVLYDLVTGQQRRLFDPGSRPEDTLEFSPDDRYLLISRGRQLWDLQTHRLLPFPWRDRNVAFFTPSGDVMVVLGPRDLGWWDLRTGRTKILSLKSEPVRDFPALSLQASDHPTLSVDGGWLAAGERYTHRIGLWSLDTLEFRKDLHGHPVGIGRLSFSPGGKTLASAGHDNTVKLWDVETGEELLTLDGFGGITWMLCFSPDGKALATLSSQGAGKPSEIILWYAAPDEVVPVDAADRTRSD